MQGKHWLVVVSFLVVVASGCRELNEDYCATHYMTDPDCPQPGGPCDSTGECSAPTPVCRTDTMTCVECVQSSDCAPSRPICSAQNTCVECEKNADCASGLCLPEGTCADPTDVAHVDGAAPMENLECSVTAPCNTLQKALTPFRKYIKATGMIVNPGPAALDRQMVTIIGEPGMTTITRVDGGGAPMLEIKKDAVVTLIDLELVGAADGHVVEIKDLPGPTVSMTRVKLRDTKDNVIQLSAGKLELTDSQVSTATLNGINMTASTSLILTNSQVSKATLVGINMTGGSLVMTGSQVFENTEDGVKATGGTIDIRRSSIYLNKGTAGVFASGASTVTIESSIITRNTGTSGGVSIISPLVTIRNSIISGNGDTATAVGGVTLNSASATFEFNTVAGNISNVDPDVGMACLNLINVSNSIFTGNVVNGCGVTWSLADTMIPGDGNKMGAPMFLNTDTANPLGPTFYRIGPTSAAKDSADPAATLNVDIDGDPRPSVTGERKDMGADELKMP